MSEKHTPTPWKRDRQWIVPATAVCDGGLYQSGEYIAETHSTIGGTQEGNTELIVRAVNCHKELLEACKAALVYLEANRPKGSISKNFHAINEHENGVVAPLRAAIAKATEQPPACGHNPGGRTVHHHDAIDLLRGAVADVERYHRGELTAEFTRADVCESVRRVLAALMDCEMSQAYIDAVID